MRHLLVAVVVAGAIGSAGFAPWGVDDGVGANYWRAYSLVYARVDHVDAVKGLVLADGREATDTKALIRPLGVVSGGFDAGLVPSMAVRLWRDARGPAFPSAGDGILLVVVAQPPRPGRPTAANGYVASENMAAYLPTPNAQFSAIKEFADPAMGDALKAVHTLRKREPPEPAYDPCLVYGELQAVWHDTNSVVVRPKVALSGSFDAANDIEVIADDEFLKHNFFLTGAKIVMWFRSAARPDGGSREYSIRPAPNSSLPVGHSPICKVTGPGDPKVAALLATFNQCTFWETHSVVYAEVVETRSPKEGKRPGTIILRPKLALSGQFDPAKAPEITLPTDAKILQSQFHTLYAGGMVLAVLTRSGDSYSITPDPTPFMPGDHGPICLIKNFEDRSVQDTLTAVQKLRHASDETKPNDEPAKH